jgi:small subunit ribosomal protein S20
VPNTKSAIKAMRSSARKRVFNQKTKDTMKSEIKGIKKLLDQGNLEEAKKKLSEAMSAIDKAAKKGVIKKNNASRKKSRLAQALNKKQQK